MAGAKRRARKAAGKAKKRGRGKRKGCAHCKYRTCVELYEKHKKMLENEKNALSKKKADDLADFAKHYEANKARYEGIAAQADVPPELIAAIHWREGSGNFDTYLHNGERLGRRTTIVPKNVFFDHGQFDEAAVAALKAQEACRKALGMDKNTRDRAKMAAFAERFNGQGYDMRNLPSPYVYSGTDLYSAGKFTSDGVFSAGTVDQQLGVIPMIDSVSP